MFVYMIKYRKIKYTQNLSFFLFISFPLTFWCKTGRDLKFCVVNSRDFNVFSRLKMVLVIIF